MSEKMKPLLGKLAARERPSRAETDTAFAAIMDGEATPAQMGAWLLGLRALGETSDDMVAAARAMRARMVKVEGGADAMDVCGTGGDAAQTLNISTAVAFILASAGQKVAKHGNRAMSRSVGGADVLEALGVNLTGDVSLLSRALAEANIAFLFAQNHHAATRHVAPVRRELGFRTLFNCLGPLTNPAGVKRQFIGVFDLTYAQMMAGALCDLGCERAWLVHGAGGINELSPAGTSSVVALEGGKITRFEIAPADAGLPSHTLAAIKGGDAAHNARAMRALFDGAPGAYRDTVLLNAAGAFVVAGKSKDMKEGVRLAEHALDTGAAKHALAKLISICGAP
jgi:anthranilate phosphoribosyltransferase